MRASKWGSEAGKEEGGEGGMHSYRGRQEGRQ